MAVTLNNGEIVNQCDANTGFNQGNVNTDIFVEPTGSIGIKTSQTTNDFYTTTLGATAPYGFDSTGTEFGHHIVIWLNVLGTPSATDGGRIVVGNGTDLGAWYTPFPSGYTGGFQPRVINTAEDFDEIVAGTWTLAGNPAQLSNITQVGGGLNVTSKVNGNFINVGVDIFTIGTGLRVDGTGNNLETIRVQDEDTTHWGWMTSAGGSYFVRGGIYFGPSTGTATSTFTDTGQVLIFSDERVASGFYTLAPRGSNTTVTLNNCVIRAANPTVAARRWNIDVDSTSVPTMTCTGGFYAGFGTFTMQSGSSFNDLTLDDGQSIVLNGATMDGCSVQNADTTSSEALILTSDLSDISNCDFDGTNNGHAIEIDSTGTFNFTGNTFTGYDTTNGSNDAMIFNDSGGLVTINVLGGGTFVSYRNGTDATTVVNQNVAISITVLDPAGDPVPGALVSIFQTNGTVILSPSPTDENGEVTSSAAASLGGIIIRARQNTNIADFLTSASGINDGTDTITTTVNHHFQDGDAVVYTKNGGSATIGLTEGTTYYVNAPSATTLTLHTTAANAIAGTAIVPINVSGTETHSLDPVRFVMSSATGTIGTNDFSAQISLVEDIIATG